MRNDEKYGPKPQSRQMEIPGLGARGEKLMADARKWAGENPDAWRQMKYQAARLARMNGYVSANYLVNYMRTEYRVSVKNAFAPAFARIIGEECPEIADAFRKHASMTDGFAG